MSKSERYTILLGILYIIYVLLYGIIVKLASFNPFFLFIKTYVPEIILVLISFLGLVRNGMRLRRFLLPLLGYSITIFLMNVTIYGLNEQALYLIRDVYIPLCAFSILLSSSFSQNGMDNFVDKLTIFFKIYLITGFLLALLQQLNGWEWASSFYTGYTFYGQDEISKVKIAHNMGLLRAPSLSGNFATFGYYCLIAITLINAKELIFWKKAFWNVLTLACLVLATNKSAIVAFIVLLTLRLTFNLRNESKIIERICFVSIVGFLCITTVLIFGDNAYENIALRGFYERLDVWQEILEGTSLIEVLVPYKQFMYGSGAEGNYSFFDNTYLYSVFTQGIIGTFMWINVIKKVFGERMRQNSVVYRNYIYELTMTLMVLGLTVNVTQGRGFFSLYLVLLGMGFSIFGGEIRKTIIYISHKSLNSLCRWRYAI